MAEVFHRFAIQLPVTVVCFLLTAIVLWRLRSLRYWTLLIGFGLFNLLLALTLLITPQSKGDSPEVQGVLLGCVMAASFMYLYLRFGRDKDQRASVKMKKPGEPGSD
jgi:hypothetical protein